MPQERSDVSRRADGGTRSGVNPAAESACLSNTQTHVSQDPSLYQSHRDCSEDDSLSQAVAYARKPSTHIDWLEGSMCVQWRETFSNRVVTEYNDLQKEAQQQGGQALMDLAVGPALMHASGMGSGRQARMTYRISWNMVTLGLAFREKTSRFLPNFYFKIPGEACLKYGAETLLNLIHEYIDSLKGVVTDDWVRRVDIATDLPEVDIQEWMIPAMLEGRFITTAHFWQVSDGKDGKRSFAVGSRNRVRLSVYDKLHEARKKTDEITFQALTERRWNGTCPQHATRVEYQISRNWLKSYGLDRIDHVLRNVPVMLSHLTTQGRGRFFTFTAVVPDREHNHQSRAGIDPHWAEVIRAMTAAAGDEPQKLTPVESGGFRASRSFGVIKGYLTAAAVHLGQTCESIDEAVSLLRYLDYLNDAKADDWKHSWDIKRRKVGDAEFISPPELEDVPF